MKKKAYIILTTVLLLISPILYRPFKINGATVGGTSPIIGVNISVTDYERTYDREFRIQELNLVDGSTYFRCTSSSANPCTQWTNGSTTQQFTLEYTIDDSSYTIDEKQLIYTYEFILDNNYVGYIKFVNPFTMDNVMGSTHQYSTFYINGSSFKISGTQLITSWTVDSYDLIRSYNTHWNFPLESYGSMQYLFDQGFEQLGINETNNMLYPIFKTQTGINIVDNLINPNDKFIVVLYSNKSIYNNTQFNNNFTYNENFSVENLHVSSSRSGYIRKLIFTNNATTQQRINMQCKRNGDKFSIFFANPFRDTYAVGTDFALTFGLTNDLLNNLNIIANGTNTSSSSVSNADTTNQQAQQTFTQEEQLVNNAEEDLQDNLDALDIQHQNNNLFGNSKFVASAQWVKLQFDNLTNNNAFGYMITFSLVIGLALVIVGKLRG